MIFDPANSFIFLKTVKSGGSQVEIACAPFLSDASIQTLDTIGGIYPEVRDRYRRTTRLPLREFITRSIELFMETPNKRQTLKGIVASYASPKGPSIRSLSIEQNHMTACDIRKIVGRENFDKCRRVAVVRCPFNRVASQFWRSEAIKNQPRRISRNQLQEEFLKWLYGNPVSVATNQNILVDEDNTTSLVDIALRYENLEASLSEIAAILRVDTAKLLDRYLSFPARNPSRPRNWSVLDIYSDEAKAFVRQHASWEFSEFGYDPYSLTVDTKMGQWLQQE